MKFINALCLCFLLTAVSSLAQDWTATAKILVQPGQSVGAIVLGQPLPDNAATLYGQPATYSAPSPGPDGQDTGSIVYGSSDGFELGKGMLIKLNDGRGDNNVYSIHLQGLRAYTPQGATMGISLAKARKFYPQGQVGTDEMTDEVTLQIPGLIMLFSNNRLTSMVVRAEE